MRCNIGFSYYDTKIGYRYPGMNSDMLKESIEAFHEQNIKVTAYLNGGLHHELLLHKLEFAKVNRDGSRTQGDPVTNNFFRSPCFNTGWREYLFSEIKEILAYHIRMGFFAIVCW